MFSFDDQTSPDFILWSHHLILTSLYSNEAITVTWPTISHTTGTGDQILKMIGYILRCKRAPPLLFSFQQHVWPWPAHMIHMIRKHCHDITIHNSNFMFTIRSFMFTMRRLMKFYDKNNTYTSEAILTVFTFM